MVTIPLRYSNLKLWPLLQTCRPESTLHGQIPCQPLLMYLTQRHHGQFPQVKPQHPCFFKTEKVEDRTPPKLAGISHMMPPQNKAEEMWRWGLHCPICAKSTPNSRAESSEDWNSGRQDQLQRNYYPQSPQYSPSYDTPDRFSEHYKTEEDRKERLKFLNYKCNLDYYSTSDSDWIWIWTQIWNIDIIMQ